MRSSKSRNCQAVTKFRQNWFKQKVKHYCLRSMDSLILFGIRKNCLISGRSLLFYQFTKWAIKLNVVIIMGYQCYQLHTKSYPILEKKLKYNETVLKQGAASLPELFSFAIINIYITFSKNFYFIPFVFINMDVQKGVFLWTYHNWVSRLI
jgi:hypothetical protein